MQFITNLKFFILLLFALALVFSPSQTPAAQAWDAAPAAILKQGLETVQEQLTGLLNGAQKQAAVVALNQGTTAMFNDAGGVIGNYEDAVIGKPTMQAALDIAAEMDQATQGRGSAASYIPNDALNSDGTLAYEGVGDGSFKYGMMMRNPGYGKLIAVAQAAGGTSLSSQWGGGNYMQQLRSGAQQQIIEKPTPMVNYVGNPSQNLFAGGNLNNFNIYLSGINNPWAFNLYFNQRYQENLANKKLAAQAEIGVSQGFESKKVNGQIVTPGAAIKTAWDNAQDLPNKVIANAKTFGELAPALAGKIATNAITSGIDTLKKAQSQMSISIGNKTNSAMQLQVQKVGPQALYGR